MSSKQTNKSTKMTLFGCIMMAIGSVIGSGVFTSIPRGIGVVGDQIGWALVLATFFVFFRTLPSLFMQSSLPASGSSYMYVAKFFHPAVGYIQSINSLIGTLNIAVMTTTFATYFAQLTGNVGNATFIMIVAIITAIIFGALGTLGAKMAGNIQSVIVVILMVALGVYIFGGFTNVALVPVTDFLVPTFEFATMWSAIAFVNYALQGGAIVASFADEIENPGFAIPFSFFVGTGIVALIYILIAFVTFSAGPLPVGAEADAATWATTMDAWNLGLLSEGFLSPAMVTFFLIAGAMFATLTTLNGSVMIYSRLHFVTARDGVWPAVFAKLNKYNVPYVSLWGSVAIAVVALLFRIPVGDLLSIVSIPGLLLGFIFYVPIVRFPYIFPHSAKNAWFRLSQPLNIFMCIAAAIIAFIMGSSLLRTLTADKLISIVVLYALAYAYYIGRWQYMKKKHNIDIIEKAKGYHPSWIEHEEKLKAAAEQTAK